MLLPVADVQAQKYITHRNVMLALQTIMPVNLIYGLSEDAYK